MVDTSQLTELISALRAETEANSVSPERVGYVLQQIVDFLPTLDSSGLTNDVATALSTARQALSTAQGATTTANAAQTAATSAQNVANSASATATQAKALADAATDAVSALIALVEQLQTASETATSTAQAASAAVAALREGANQPGGMIVLNSNGKVPNGLLPDELNDTLEFSAIMASATVASRTSEKKSTDSDAQVFYVTALKQFVLGVRTDVAYTDIVADAVPRRDGAVVASRLTDAQIKEAIALAAFSTLYDFYHDWADRDLYSNSDYTPHSGKTFICTSTDTSYYWKSSVPALQPMGKDLFDGNRTILQPNLAYGFFMAANNTYQSHSTYKGFFMAVSPGEKYVIKKGDNVTMMAVVTNKSISSNMSIPFATGYEERITINDTNEITIPEDGRYIFVQSVLGSGNCRPIIELQRNKLDDLDEKSVFEDVVGIYDGQQIGAYIAQNNAWSSSPIGRASVCFPLEYAISVRIKANSTYGTYFAFLTSVETDTVHFSDGCETRATVAVGVETSELSVPNDAKFLYIFTGDALANMPERITIRKTSSSEQIHKDYSELSAHIGDEDFAIWGNEIDINNSGTAYSSIFIGNTANPDKWVRVSGKTTRVDEIPTGAKFVRIQSNMVIPFAILRSTKAPVANQQYECTSAYQERLMLPIGTTVLPLQADCKAIAWVETAINAPAAISFSIAPTSLSDFDKNEQTEYFLGKTCDTPSFVDAPIPCISTDDANATIYDNRIIGNVSVVKVNDSMYYMYYVCAGQNDPYNDKDLHLAMAYSTDGFNWVRGIPNGIEPPIAGTNLLLNSGCIGECVVKVQDKDYPFRMIGGNWHASTDM